MLCIVRAAGRSLGRQNVVARVTLLRTAWLIVIQITSGFLKVSLLLWSADTEEHRVIGYLPQKGKSFQLYINEHLSSAENAQATREVQYSSVFPTRLIHLNLSASLGPFSGTGTVKYIHCSLQAPSLTRNSYGQQIINVSCLTAPKARLASVHSC